MDVSEDAPDPLGRAAMTIAPLVGFRHTVSAPEYLSSGHTNEAGPSAAGREVVSAYWNAARRVLDQDGLNGLEDLVRRLQPRRKAAADARDSVRDPGPYLEGFRDLVDWVRTESERYGEFERVRESLGTLPAPSPGAFFAWRWEPGPNADEAVAEGRDPAGRYTVEATIAHALHYDRPDDFTAEVELDSETQWWEVLEPLEARLGARGAEAFRLKTERERLTALVQTIDFRVRVIKAVIEEYEVLGHVPEHGAGPTATAQDPGFTLEGDDFVVSRDSFARLFSGVLKVGGGTPKEAFDETVTRIGAGSPLVHVPFADWQQVVDHAKRSGMPEPLTTMRRLGRGAFPRGSGEKTRGSG